MQQSSSSIANLAAALAKAAAMVPMVSLERCTAILHLEEIETDGAGF